MKRRERILGASGELAVPLAALALLAIWSAGRHSPYFPPLADVWAAFRDMWLFEHAGSDAVPSVERMVAGLAIAVTAGVAGGVPLGRAPRVRRAVTPLIEVLRAIPPPALLPAAIVAIGVGDRMKIALIAFVCVWPVLLNAIDGAAGLDPTLEDTARAYRIGRRDRLLHVVLPAAAPQIFAGLRHAVSLALIVMVISEMVASTNGVGHQILQAQRTFATAEMWSGVVLLAVLGYTLNALLAAIERRALRWHRAAHRSALRQ